MLIYIYIYMYVIITITVVIHEWKMFASKETRYICKLKKYITLTILLYLYI